MICQLLAITEHIGSTLSSGHYVCKRLNKDRNVWTLHSDDKMPTIVPTNEVMTSSAYMLFYEKIH